MNTITHMGLLHLVVAEISVVAITVYGIDVPQIVKIDV